MMKMIRRAAPHILALLVWLVFCQAELAGAVSEDPLEIQPEVFWSNIRTAQELADYFEKRSNLKTGLSLSFYGDDPHPIALYGTQISDVGLRLLADSSYSQQIVDTFARNSSSGGSRNSPQIAKTGNASKEGIFSWIRIEGFDQPQWWNAWEWSIKVGENAWFGKGALHYYRQTHDAQGLQIALERAEFILGLQDQDGAVRVGPVNPQDNFWWNIKSTEHNESALNFLDEIYLTTHDLRYKQAADRIYEWQITVMYNKEQHLFTRAEVFKQGGWVADDLQMFAADTTSWAPLQRILEDPRFGQNRRERLGEVERMLAATLAQTGVFENGILKGISYSPRSRDAAVISVDGSSQLALRYLLISSEFHDEGVLDKAIEYHMKYVDLIGHLQGYIHNTGGEKTVPYAVYPDNRIAANEPMWDETVRTPQANASIASHLYLGFALQRFDPLLDRNI
jgi:hypothetical protein